MLVPAIITITVALILCSIGIWRERIQGILEPWQAVLFGAAALRVRVMVVARRQEHAQPV